MVIPPWQGCSNPVHLFSDVLQTRRQSRCVTNSAGMCWAMFIAVPEASFWQGENQSGLRATASGCFLPTSGSVFKWFLGIWSQEHDLKQLPSLGLRLLQWELDTVLFPNNTVAVLLFIARWLLLNLFNLCFTLHAFFGLFNFFYTLKIQLKLGRHEPVLCFSAEDQYLQQNSQGSHQG